MKEFTVPNRFEGTEPEFVPFALSGVGLVSGEAWREEFRTVPKGCVPAGALDDVLSGVRVDARGRQVWSNVSIIGFMEQVLHPDDQAKFRALVHDNDRYVELEVLGQIMVWLMEELVEVPTVRRSVSTPGPSGAGGGSVVGISSVEVPASTH